MLISIMLYRVPNLPPEKCHSHPIMVFASRLGFITNYTLHYLISHTSSSLHTQVTVISHLHSVNWNIKPLRRILSSVFARDSRKAKKQSGILTARGEQQNTEPVTRHRWDWKCASLTIYLYLFTSSMFFQGCMNHSYVLLSYYRQLPMLFSSFYFFYLVCSTLRLSFSLSCE